MPKHTDAMLRIMEAWPDRWQERALDTPVTEIFDIDPDALK